MSVPEARSRSGRRKYLLLLGLLIPVIVLGGYWYFYIRLPCLAEFRAGGMRMTLVKIVEGRLIHRWTDPVPNWVRKNVPAVNRVFPLRVTGDFDSADWAHYPLESHWFVFRLECSPNYMPPLANMLFQKMELESDGHIYPGKESLLMGEFYAYHSEAVPRRSRKLNIRLTELNGNLIKISVDNPFYKEQFPEWTPGPFPAKETRGPFTVELNDFAYGQDGGVHPLVTCQCSDPSLEPCSVDVTIEDATGNRGPFVSPYEKTWNVVATLNVSKTAQSPLNQRFPIGNITVPAANTVVPWTKSAKAGEVSLPIRAIVGPGTYELVRGTWQVAVGKDPNSQVKGPAILMDYVALPFHETLCVTSLGQPYLK
jgi:hypothetical protein